MIEPDGPVGRNAVTGTERSLAQEARAAGRVGYEAELRAHNDMELSGGRPEQKVRGKGATRE